VIIVVRVHENKTEGLHDVRVLIGSWVFVIFEVIQPIGHEIIKEVEDLNLNGVQDWWNRVVDERIWCLFMKIPII
jgi:hypothetical protein